LQDGQELEVDDIQVQRAGGEGFSHNEINPDTFKNRMIQLWVIPETYGEPADYKMFHAMPHGRTRVYGGPPEQEETFAARTIIEVAHLEAGETLQQSGTCLVYVTTGAGTCEDETIREGDLVDTRNLKLKVLSDSKLILIYEE